MRQPRLIERPDFERTGGRAPIYDYERIIGTLGTSRAVLIRLNGERRAEQVISSIGKTVRRRGYRFRHRMEKRGVAVWVERK